MIISMILSDEQRRKLREALIAEALEGQELKPKPMSDEKQKRWWKALNYWGPRLAKYIRWRIRHEK